MYRNYDSNHEPEPREQMAKFTKPKRTVQSGTKLVTIEKNGLKSSLDVSNLVTFKWIFFSKLCWNVEDFDDVV